MNEPTITCPTCKSDIKLTESLAGPLVEQTRLAFVEQLSAKDQLVAQAHAEVAAEKKRIELERQAIDATLSARLDEARKQIAVDEAERAKRVVAADMEERDRKFAELQETLASREEKLRLSQAAEAEMLKKQRELDDKLREVDLAVQQQVNEGLEAVRATAKQEAEDALSLKVKERDTQIASMQQKIEELKKKAEQGSQQLQGEAQELMLEDMLRARFPFDQIEPVGKGEFGGDVLQRVVNPAGQVCGSILWETKRTRTWSDGWLSKLKGDLRAAKADLALIVSHALPKDIETFGQMEGVWITGPKCAMPVAMSLRESLVLMNGVRAAGEGQQTKSALMYDYLTGPRFRHRIEAVVEKFSDMQDDLASERKATMKRWAKREQQLHTVLDSTAGLYGDLQGIAGRSMLEIEALEAPLLEAPDDED
ncbi:MULTISPECIES: DUF2130 domain-containing protein [Brevundimonas]|uniref:DUF2130 domain-containing protein n=1 Tax=Brevundimonas fontaquae TaxID=2813778 RepID=A0ABX7LMJ0_9CAUL|nr:MULTISPECIES: DUF2130 domain-containing protein [Brevundimonas]QIF81692.1 DUF2130 domain-containing protein [Brevundimonas sp. 'scallop']QSF53369.1 DUF2130 domain-containing protein [Brevundimonas fontaquae]